MGHGLHATGDDNVGFASVDHEVSQVDGVETRQAHLVDGGGWHGHWNATSDSCLASGDLTSTGFNDVAHDDHVDLVASDASALQGFSNGETTKLSGAEARQRARELANWGAGTCCNNGSGHESSSVESALWSLGEPTSGLVRPCCFAPLSN